MSGQYTLNLKSENFEKGTVVYHVGHISLLWKFLTHKQYFHKECAAIFFIDIAYITEITGSFLKERMNEFPHSIVYYNDESLFFRLNSVDEVENKIMDVFDKIFIDFDIKPQDCLAIYSGIDTRNAFGVYLNMKNISYTLCDMGIRFITIYRKIVPNERNPKETNYIETLYKYNVLTCYGSCVNSVIWASEDAPQIDKPSSVIDFRKLIGMLADKERQDILDFFNVPSFTDTQSYNVVVTSSGWGPTEAGYTKATFFQVYRTLSDYIFGDDPRDVIIKPHPNYDFSDSTWQSEFPGSKCIRGYVPAELLMYVPGLKVNKILSTSNNATDIGIGAMKINLSSGSLEAFRIHHRLYAAFQVINTINKSNKIVFNITKNIDIFSEKFAKCVVNTPDQHPKLSFLILDSEDSNGRQLLEDRLKNLDQNLVIIFLNSDEHDFNNTDFDPEIGKCLIQIKKTRKIDGISIGLEKIHVYCKNENILNDINKININKNMKNSRIEINISAISHAEWADLESQSEGAQIYLSGEGVEADKTEAIRRLKESVEVGSITAVNEYIDALIKNSTEDGLKEAFEIGSKYAENGLPETQIRIARMCYEGKGTEKNIDMAIEWMRKATDKIGWTKNELTDMLLERSTNNDLEEAYTICSEFAKTGNAGAMGRLGRMYYEGKGVTKNMEKAIEWMGKASEKNGSWEEEFTKMTKN